MRTNKLLILLFVLLSQLCYAQKEEGIVLKSHTGDIYGTLTQASSKTVAILIAGSGPTDRNGNNPQMQNNSLKMIAQALAESGISSVRFDKRGIAQSNKAMISESDLRFEHYVEDVKLWVDKLNDDKRFNKIVIIGHSEGALIGMIASENNSKVKAVVSIAGVGTPADQILKKQLGEQLYTQKELKDYCFAAIDKLKKGEKVTDVPLSLQVLFRESVQPYMTSWFIHNPQEVIANLKQPILILQGDKDIQVSVTDAELLQKANPKAVKTILPNMNHILKEIFTTAMVEQLKTYSDPSLPLHKQLAPAIVQFIQ